MLLFFTLNWAHTNAIASPYGSIIILLWNIYYCSYYDILVWKVEWADVWRVFWMCSIPRNCRAPLRRDVRRCAVFSRVLPGKQPQDWPRKPCAMWLVRSVVLMPIGSSLDHSSCARREGKSPDVAEDPRLQRRDASSTRATSEWEPSHQHFWCWLLIRWDFRLQIFPLAWLLHKSFLYSCGN